MDISILMQRFSDPSVIHSLSYSEKIQATMFVIFMGMGVTFIVLVVLQFCIGLMSRLMIEKPEKSVTKNNEEEIAVAISTAMLVANVPVDRIVVESVKK